MTPKFRYQPSITVFCEPLVQCFTDVASIPKHLAKQRCCHILNWRSIIRIARSDFNRYKLALMIDNGVQLKAVKLAHTTFISLRHTLKDFMAVDTLVMTNCYLG